MRPRAIILFERLFVAVLVISGVQTWVSWTNAGWALANTLGGNAFMIFVTVTSYTLYAALWFFIAHRASRMARAVFAGLTVLGLIGLPISLRNAVAWSPLGMAPMLVSSALQLACVALLFTPSARAWFAARGDPVDPGAFE